MNAARGKFIFILDEGGEHRNAYLLNHASLKGRVLFTDSPSGTPEAAFMIINDSKKESAHIREMVKKGYYEGVASVQELNQLYTRKIDFEYIHDFEEEVHKILDNFEAKNA